MYLLNEFSGRVGRNAKLVEPPLEDVARVRDQVVDLGLETLDRFDVFGLFAFLQGYGGLDAVLERRVHHVANEAHELPLEPIQVHLELEGDGLAIIARDERRGEFLVNQLLGMVSVQSFVHTAHGRGHILIRSYKEQ